jgi:hypothetical protein
MVDGALVELVVRYVLPAGDELEILGRCKGKQRAEPAAAPPE